MKKFKIKVPCNYIQGHLRYGHGEAIIEAENIEQAKEKAKEWDDYDLIVDDYEVYDHDTYDFANMQIIEMEDNENEESENQNCKGRR